MSNIRLAGAGLLLAAVLCLAGAGSSVAASHVQSDWSGGAGSGTAVPQWSDRFSAAGGVSWRSVGGQLSLTSNAMTATGAFVSSTTPLCRAVASGDLDGDGDVDLVTAIPLGGAGGTGEVRWYENAGDGATWTPHSVDLDFYGGNAVTAADFDGDGDLDLGAAAFYGNPQEDGRYAWYRNDSGDGSAWTKQLIAGNLWGTQMVAAFDMDQDGDLDILGSSTLTTIGSRNDTIYWFENVDGVGGSWTQRTIDPSFPDAIEADAADIDRDGDPDVVCVSYGDNEISWWENGGGGLTWTKRVITSFTFTDNAISVADLDDDGDPDVVAAGFGAGSVNWFENADGRGGSWVQHTVGPLPNGADVNVADLDGDGRLDVLAANSDATFSQVYWFRNLGGATSWALNVVNQGHDSGMAAIAADLDGDGALEVAFTEEGSFSGDISGIHHRDITQFGSSGQLDSEVLDAGGPVTWTAIDWDASTPAGTALALQVRSSNDAGDVGPWSADIGSPGSLDGILAPDTRYVQYRVLLSSSDPAVSPVVREVTLQSSAGATDAPDIAAVVGLSLGVPRPNPTTGPSAVHLSLGAPGFARLDVVDVGGRLVATPIARVLAEGSHRAELPALVPGVYFVRLSAGGATVSRKLVVAR